MSYLFFVVSLSTILRYFWVTKSPGLTFACALLAPRMTFPRQCECINKFFYEYQKSSGWNLLSKCERSKWLNAAAALRPYYSLTLCTPTLRSCKLSPNLEHDHSRARGFSRFPFSVIFGLDPNIQVKQGIKNFLDPRVYSSAKASGTRMTADGLNLKKIERLNQRLNARVWQL